ARGGGIVLVEVPERPDPAAEGREAVRRRGRAGPAARRGARRAAGELGGHAGAGADARLDVPLGPQPVEGGDHRPAGEPVLAREVAGGREPGAGGEAAVEDPGADGGVEPPDGRGAGRPGREHERELRDAAGHGNGTVNVPYPDLLNR